MGHADQPLHADALARAAASFSLAEYWMPFTPNRPAACAAGLATLDICRNDGLFERGSALAPYLQDAIFSLADHPAVADVRGYGMITGIDLHAAGAPGARGHAFQKKLFANGMHLKATGDCVIVAPPLIAEKSHVDVMTDILRKTLSQV